MLTLQTLKKILILVTIITVLACSKEPVNNDIHADVQTAPESVALFIEANPKANTAVKAEANLPAESVAASTVNPVTTSLTTSSKADSQWVKVSDEKPTLGNTEKKMIPVAEEVGPASALLQLERHRGKVIYLDFWASWCTPCRKSFPFMNKIQEKYKDDLVVIGVNLDEDPELANQFLEKYPANFEIIYDQFWQAGREYGIYGLPFSFVYNRQGELVGKHGGFTEGDDINLDAALQNLINLGE